MTPRLLVLDWGIGGAGALARLRQAYPRVPAVYWSDSGQTPYGRLAPDVLARRLELVLDRAAAIWGITHALIACNAASTVLERVRAGLHVAGVIAPAVAYLGALPPQTIGVIGGVRTIASRAYAAPLMAAGHEVVGVATQPLSALIEAGAHARPGALAHVEPLLRGLEHVDTLAMACTHYPAARALIGCALPGVALYDPLDAAMEWVGAHWGESFEQVTGPAAGVEVVTTGDPEATARAARLAFGVRWEDVRALKVERSL